MAICEECKQDMLTAHGCTEVFVFVNNKFMPRLAYGHDQRAVGLDPTSRCHDCNVTWDHLHHPGCDMEECPGCHRQVISCACIIVAPSPESLLRERLGVEAFFMLRGLGA